GGMGGMGGMMGGMGGMMGGMGGMMGGMGGMMGGGMGGMRGGGPNGPAGGEPAPKADPVPIPVSGGAAPINPENSSIGFVGLHGPNDSMPRTGGFGKFSGDIKIDEASKSITSITAEIETESLWTTIPQLTSHLTSPDFFDARQFPKATFASTKVEPGSEPGKLTIAGNLTLLATTKEISFPATVTMDDKGLLLNAEFSIDRTHFGMDKLEERVHNMVEIKVAVGQKTQTASAEEPAGAPAGAPGAFGPGGGSGDGPQGGGRRGFGPAGGQGAPGNTAPEAGAGKSGTK
ncbi:MAG: YceI family protein, partial [Planctomycetes bacterium]|nr:YceI family protein [Planctomycetota bacterium]